MNYLMYAFLAATCFALSQVLNKLLSKHSMDNRDSLMAYFMLTSFTFGFFMLPFIPWTLPPLSLLGIILVAVLLFMAGSYSFFEGVFHADASSFAPLFQLQAAFVGILAFLFLGERFPVQNYLWMILLIVGTILVSYDEKMSLKSFFNRGILFILLMQVLHASSNIFVGKALQQSTPLQILFWEDMIIGVLFAIFWFVRKPKMKYSVGQVAPMFLSSYITGVGIISLFTAFSINLTISSVIGLLCAPIVFVISVVASKLSPTFLEHHSWRVYAVRGIGLAVILFGAYKITVG
jgi:drug/metabolite transporter (DMT)-like permease